MNTEKLPVQVSIDDLRALVNSPEDRETLAKWQEEANEERKKAVDSLLPPAKLHEYPDGTFVTTEEHRNSVENGENPSGPYDGGPRA